MSLEYSLLPFVDKTFNRNKLDIKSGEISLIEILLEESFYKHFLNIWLKDLIKESQWIIIKHYLFSKIGTVREVTKDYLFYRLTLPWFLLHSSSEISKNASAKTIKLILDKSIIFYIINPPVSYISIINSPKENIYENNLKILLLINHLYTYSIDRKFSINLDTLKSLSELFNITALDLTKYLTHNGFTYPLKESKEHLILDPSLFDIWSSINKIQYDLAKRQLLKSGIKIQQE